jgi:hypothetical protein
LVEVDAMPDDVKEFVDYYMGLPSFEEAFFKVAASLVTLVEFIIIIVKL